MGSNLISERNQSLPTGRQGEARMNLDRFVGEAITLMRRSPDVAYGDIRVLVSEKREGLAVKNGIVENVNRSEVSGFGVRILSPKGAWGFASLAGLGRSEVALECTLSLSD